MLQIKKLKKLECDVKFFPSKQAKKKIRSNHVKALLFQKKNYRAQDAGVTRLIEETFFIRTKPLTLSSHFQRSPGCSLCPHPAHKVGKLLLIIMFKMH